METHQYPIPELLSLQPSVTLLDSAALGPLHSLLVDHILLERTLAYSRLASGRGTKTVIVFFVPFQPVLLAQPSLFRLEVRPDVIEGAFLPLHGGLDRKSVV